MTEYRVNSNFVMIAINKESMGFAILATHIKSGTWAGNQFTGD